MAEDILFDDEGDNDQTNLEMEKLLKENWKLIGGPGEPPELKPSFLPDAEGTSLEDELDEELLPDQEWAHRIPRNKLAEMMSKDMEEEEDEESIDIANWNEKMWGDASNIGNTNVFALMYELKNNPSNPSKLTAAMEEHDLYTKNFELVQSSELIDVGVMKGVVTLWSGPKGQDRYTRNQIETYKTRDPLVVGGFVETMDVLELGKLSEGESN
jgi:hypothetical protein